MEGQIAHLVAVVVVAVFVAAAVAIALLVGGAVAALKHVSVPSVPSVPSLPLSKACSWRHRVLVTNGGQTELQKRRTASSYLVQAQQEGTDMDNLSLMEEMPLAVAVEAVFLGRT